MPPCWMKSSKKSKKKSSREIIIDWHRKYIRRAAPQERCNDIAVEKGSQDGTVSQRQSPPPNIKVSQSQIFGEGPQAQPLPLPGSEFTNTCGASHGNRAHTEASLDRGQGSTVLLPAHKSGCVEIRKFVVGRDSDLAPASSSSDSFSDIHDPSDSCPLSPQTSDCDKGIKSATVSPTGVIQMGKTPFFNKKNSRGTLTPPASILLQKQTATASCKQVPMNSHVSWSQIPHKDVLQNAPDSSVSSPSTSPMKDSGLELLMGTSLCLGKPYVESLIGSGHCSSPGSGYNSISGDMPSQLLWPQSRCSPEYSPSPSPRMTSPGPGSSIHSGAVTPLYPRVGSSSTMMPTACPDDGKKQAYRLPLPPLKISNPCPFSTCSARTSPRTQLGSPSSPASCWKKGQQLGRGTFGNVYIGFNSETGEMCAMKEVALFSDDVRSKESAQHLRQEILFLSRLHHPNIVQYYGSASLDDKLYIYLEYVSGGSLHKILRDYGPLGEAAIQSYTQQILSGLAYLHSKNTLHRDIKGANILVDPNGRVKLADFGLAKHIGGQSGPMSLKGSPYWMAPELIGNSSNCNLAVDIWSLGCTVLEMATTKPPWSQYEGVAAMFKIVNSKELPPVPDRLSSNCKDFVLKCLQRDTCKRPTATQLLEHPFIKRSASLAMRAPGLENSEALLHLDSPRAVNQISTLKAAPGFSDSCKIGNVSCRMSEPASPTLSSQSPQNVNERVSPMLSPRATSGSRSAQNVSGRVSPMLSPRSTSGSRSPQNVNGRVSLMLSPRATSGSWSPQNVNGSVSPMLSPQATSGSQSPQNVNGRVSSMLSPQPTSGSRSPQNVNRRVSPMLGPQATSGSRSQQNVNGRVSSMLSPRSTSGSQSSMNVNGRVSPKLNPQPTSGSQSRQNMNVRVSSMLSPRPTSGSLSAHNVNGQGSPMLSPRPTSGSLSPHNVNGRGSPMLSPLPTSGSLSPHNVNGRVSSMLSPRPTSGPLSPHNVNARVSPMLSPRPTSGYSTPSGSGSGTPATHHQKQPKNNLPEHVGSSAGSRSTIPRNDNGSQDHKSNVFQVIVQAHLSLETVPQKSELVLAEKEQEYNGHLVLADRVSQQLLMNPLRLDPASELTSKPSNAWSQ